MTKILVTGAGGQLGQCFLANEINEIQVIGKTRLQLDITSKEQINQALEQVKPDVVVNCAGYTDVDGAETEIGGQKSQAVNVEGVKNLVACCNQQEIKLVHISTDYVFGGKTQANPFKESDEFAPINTYGRDKSLGEQHIISESKDYLIFRTAWLFSEFGHNFAKTILKKLINGDDVTVVANQVGSPTSAFELARMVLVLLKDSKLKNEIVNCANVGVGSWYDIAFGIWKLAEKAGTKTGGVTPIYYSPAAYPAKRPSYSVLNLEKLIQHLGDAPPHWSESLETIINSELLK